MNKIIYNPKLKKLARQLRNRSTQSEIRLWMYLKGKQLKGYDFHRQKPIDNYIVDFFCGKLMMAIELDGCTHEFEEVLERDNVKTQKLREFGITVLRFNGEDIIKNIDGVMESIKAFIVEKEKGDTHPLIPSF